MNIIEQIEAEILRQKGLLLPIRSGSISIKDVHVLLNSLYVFVSSFQGERCEDLESEMSQFIATHYHVRFDETLENGSAPLKTYDFVEIARHFAEWQETKMIKGAFRGEVTVFRDGNKALRVNCIERMLNGCNGGDMVKVIIIKENQE